MERTEEISTEKALVIVEALNQISVEVKSLLEEEDAITLEDIRALEDNVKQHTEMLDRMRNRISHMEAKLRKDKKVDALYNQVHFERANIMGLRSILAEARNELDSLLRKEEEEESIPETEYGELGDEDEGEDGDDEESCESEETVSEEVSSSRNIKRVCKTLFAKIASRTHPDKTNNAELIELFSVARSYYKAYNLPGLSEIWEAVQGGKSKFQASKLRKLRDSLAQQLEEVLHELQQMMNSGSADLVKIFHYAGEHYAIIEYLGMLRRELASTLEERDHILNTLGKIQEEIKVRKRCKANGI